jgi:hypothetical protein
MDAKRELVRIDDAGVVRPLGKVAIQRLRAHKGTYRLMPGPPHALFLRDVGEDGQRDAGDGAVVRLAGEITGPGAICDVVALVAQAGWRGELIVLSVSEDGDVSRTIFFEAGNVLGALTTAPGERVGDIMYKLGALSAEEIDVVSQQVQSHEGRKFGQLAVDLGLIGSERLFNVMQKQVEEIVFASLRVADGMFYFLDGFDETRVANRHHVSANGLLMEGVRRMDEVKYFRERIPSDEHIPAQVQGKADVPDELSFVFSSCDGHRSVAEVGRACGMTEFEITQAIFQLVQSGHLKVEPPKPTGAPALVAIFNDAIREIHRTAQAHGLDGALRDHLSSYALSVGIYDMLFMGAGPKPDGSVDEDRVAKNIVMMAGDESSSTLAGWLYEYAAFALFDASSTLPKGEDQGLSKRVGERIALLAPK